MIDTAFTRRFGLKHPVALAPVPGMACGHLAAAVSDAGGLGLIGCGSQDPEWIAAEFEKTGDVAVGCGLYCDGLADGSERLEAALRFRPRAVYLSRGDPSPYVEALKRARVPVICEVASLAHAKCATAAGADVIVAKGTDAAGQTAARTMFNLVPELTDHMRRTGDDTLLLAFGGITDARTLSAVIALGADGAMMLTRLALSSDARLPVGLIEAGLARTGDDASRDGFSQGVGLIRDVRSVRDILDQLSHRAEKVLSHSMRAVIK